MIKTRHFIRLSLFSSLKVIIQLIVKFLLTIKYKTESPGVVVLSLLPSLSDLESFAMGLHGQPLLSTASPLCCHQLFWLPTPTNCPQNKLLSSHLRLALLLALGACHPLSPSLPAKYQIEVLFFYALLPPACFVWCGPVSPLQNSPSLCLLESLRHNSKASASSMESSKFSQPDMCSRAQSHCRCVGPCIWHATHYVLSMHMPVCLVHTYSTVSLLWWLAHWT